MNPGCQSSGSRAQMDAQLTRIFLHGWNEEMDRAIEQMCSYQMTAVPCAVDLGHYTRAKASQSQQCAEDRCHVGNETMILAEFGGTFNLYFRTSR
ncbi:hypothetical protein TNCV_194911 [Trichonephila clavipes]|uniref:Uncharacterized protein n=1 Tax=Trichonephila clavipes TaxID=2585209 RepID=A0A8X6WHY1_TRICX|nr:hypothetical protein TNCV_194911 [Trichonephila clavipes]